VRPIHEPPDLIELATHPDHNYVSSFSRYNEIYGTLGVAVVLLLWFWFTSLAILLGAGLNEALVIHGRARSDG
jgi:uncharacterized BrkB/YihY/UPF0761 family membrane protein